VILRSAICDFLPENAILLKKTVDLEVRADFLKIPHTARYKLLREPDLPAAAGRLNLGTRSTVTSSIFTFRP
jgi:hypothetical protein